MTYVVFLCKSSLIEKSVDAGLIMWKSLIAKKLEIEDQNRPCIAIAKGYKF